MLSLSKEQDLFVSNSFINFLNKKSIITFDFLFFKTTDKKDNLKNDQFTITINYLIKNIKKNIGSETSLNTIWFFLIKCINDNSLKDKIRHVKHQEKKKK